MYLVDTNIVSVGSPVWEAAPTALVSWMEENSAGLYLSTVTIAEVEDGIARLRREQAGRKAEGLSAWLDTLLHLYGERVLSFGLQEVRIAGALSDGARAKGRSPGFSDIIIAATASAHNLILLTRNQRHFEPLGVKTSIPSTACRNGLSEVRQQHGGSDTNHVEEHERFKGSSIQASKATSGAPSISMRATRSTRRRWPRSFAPPWP